MMWRRLADMVRRRRVAADLEAQLAHHLESLEREFREQGLSEHDARAAARRAMGGLTQVRDAYHDRLRVPLLDTLGQDVRHGCRLLWRHRAFTVVAASILAVGIAAATTIFSFVDAVLLKPLPYAGGERIVRLLERRPDGGTAWVSTRAFLEWASEDTLFESIAAQQQGLVTLTGSGNAVPLRVARVTARYFDVFGVMPRLGRTFRAGEDTPGREHVVVLSHALWQQQFGGDRSVLGRSIVLDNDAYTIVGVMPPDSAFDRGYAQLWQPLAFRPANMTWDYRWLSASFARLRPGVSIDQARTRMAIVAARIAAEQPNSNRGWGVVVDRYADAIVGPQLRTALLALAAAVVGLLLICCCNLASLVLVRALSRTSEVAVRAALGASRRRLLQQLIVEHALLTAVGGILGVLLAGAAVDWLTGVIPQTLLPSEASIRLDGRVLLFGLAVAIVSGIVCGLTPALRGSRAGLAAAMGRPGTTATASRQRLLDALVIGEVAVAFVLVCGSALLIRTLVALVDTDPALATERVLTMRLPVRGFPPGSGYTTPGEFITYVRAIEETVAAIPGVQRVGLTSALPLTDCCLYGLNLQVANRPVVDRARRSGGFFKVVTPGYFSTLGLPLRKGRLLDERDREGALPALVVNERFASRYFPDEDPIGQHVLNPRIVPGRTERGADISWEIVGVVANEKTSTLNDDSSAVVYASYAQSPVYFANLVVRGATAPGAIERSVRKALSQLDKDQAVLDVRTLEQLKSASVAGTRGQATMMSAFSTVAVLLAAIGIYGVLAYSVALRRREIGIRAALGASASRLLRSVLAHGLTVTSIGLAIGLTATLALAPLLASVLYHVQPRDPSLLALATSTVIAVALLAAALPARRAARADPIAVLRGE